MLLFSYETLVLVFTPLARAIAGWIEIALDDGVITWPEWRQLLHTVLRLGVPAFALYFGTSLPVEFAAALPVLADYVYKYIKSIVEKIRAPAPTPAQ